MMENLLETTGAQVGGYTVTLGAIGLWSLEWLMNMPFDYFLKIGMGIGGVLFIYYKVLSQRLERKINQQIFEENERKRERELKAEKDGE